MFKRLLRNRFISRLHQRLVLDRAGYGRVVPPSALDREYASGAWAHFHGIHELARMAVIVVMATSLRANPSVLDIGCGSGRLAQLFQPYQPRRYLGVDVSAEGLKQTEALGLKGCEFICANYETWRPREVFDLVMFVECIGYAHDPGATIKNYLPALAPGGYLVISHFRSGHWQAHWRRIMKHVEVVETTTVTNSRGQTWDIKILRPREGPNTA